MQSEFDKVSGFKDWYAEKQAEMQSDEAMRFFNKKRVATIHQKTIKPLAHVKVNIAVNLTITPSISIVIIRNDGTVEKRELEPTSQPAAAIDNNVETEWRWYFNDLPDKDVVTLCKEYFAKLENLVTECESNFTS